jgi:uncharacterized protein (TIGR03067 family)
MAIDLTGSWHGVYAEVDGEALPASYSRSLESSYRGNEFSIKIRGELEHAGTYSINESRTPPQITFVYTKSSRFPLNTPRTGILQVVGETYKNCIGVVGAQPPSGFNTTAHSDTALTVLHKRGGEEPSTEGGIQPGGPFHPPPRPLPCW